MAFPVLTATGYFDDDQPGALRYYRNHEAHAPAEALSRSYLVIGPWDHGGTQQPSKISWGYTIPDAAVLGHAGLSGGLGGLGPGPRGKARVLPRQSRVLLMLGATSGAMRHRCRRHHSRGVTATFCLSATRRGRRGICFTRVHLWPDIPAVQPPAISRERSA